MFEEWLKAKHDVSRKAFGLRSPQSQQEVIDEYNKEQRAIVYDYK